MIAVSICGYLIKYRAKQKEFHFTTQIMNLEKFYINKCIIKMNNKVKDMDTKNRTYCFFNVIINIENFNANNVKIDEKPYNNILIYYTRCGVLLNPPTTYSPTNQPPTH